MIRMPAVRVLFAIAAAVGAAAPPIAVAQSFEAGRTVKVSDYEVDFAKAAKACLKLCTEVVVERQTYDCTGHLAVPLEGCPLPWLESESSNPDFGGACIPPVAEFDGFGVTERVDLVQRRVRQAAADCTTTVTETVLSHLAPTGNPPPRPCPDPGPWSSTSERIHSIRIVACR